MPRDSDQDPYAPPPRYKERSGAVMRFVILAALLGAAAWAYVNFSNQPQTASLTAPAQEEQVADAGSPAQPRAQAAAPAGATPASAPPPARASAPATRSAPAPSENVPPPSTSIGTPPAG